MRERRSSIDALKTVCAFMVIAIHAPLPGEFGNYFMALCRIAVPIFFMITGYFYSDAEKRGKENKQIIKIFKLLIISAAIYIIKDLIFSQTVKGYDPIYPQIDITYFLRLLLFNYTKFSVHLWYLSAVLYTLIIVKFAYKRNLKKLLFIITPMLLLGNLFLDEFSFIFFKGRLPLFYSRNFLFTGIPFFCIGYFIRKNMGKRITKRMLTVMIVLFGVTALFGKYADNYLKLRNSGIIISIICLSVAVFLFALKTELPERLNFMAVFGRKYSTWCYIIHMLVMTFLYLGCTFTGFGKYFKYVQYIGTAVLTVVLLITADKIKCALKKRCEH